MSVNWTEEQKQVIWSRNRNLLVSAAAGSGKTAVLVERIIQMVTDRERPMEIDRLLVMTFTNAAAAEMRERVAAAIDRQLEEHPEDVHLQRQSTLVNQAQITTIDSFCLSLIRNHFNQLDIDPAFRIGDEGELMLLQADVLEEMLEEHYQADDDRFLQFVETYASGKSDSGIEDYIMQVYRFSQSNPWPRQWIAACRKELEAAEGAAQAGTAGTAAGSAAELSGEQETSLWMHFLLEDVRRQAEELADQTEEAVALCREPSGPAAYEPMLELDLRLLRTIAGVSRYEELYGILSQVSFGRLAAIRSKDVDPQLKTFVSGCRDRVKKTVGKWRDSYCFETPEEMAADMAGSGPAVSVLLDLAEEFSDRFQEKKREKNLVDFNDLEHYALEILLPETDGVRKPGPVADELSRQYEEILVDEYQDSNQVQETLITSISRERFGSPNVFMVGDVKQSIYKFRLARPELFLEKYESYTKDESLYQKIELHQNFRSRAQVLEGINDIFYKIMTRGLGGIAYTQDTALHPGACFEETDGRTAGEPKLLLVNTGGDLLKQLDDENADYTAKELEARMIAGEIRKMTDPETGLKVWDKELKVYRTARYSDMVILLRSLSGWSEVFVNVLMNQGIPAYAQTRTGYFTTIEVETVLAVLSVIDNPMNDIPLAAVMRSPIGGLNDQELAHMTALYRKQADKGQDRGIYGAWRNYLEILERTSGEIGCKPGTERVSGSEPECELTAGEQEIGRKLKRLDDILGRLRRESVYLPIHRLMERLFALTGYYDYVWAMPGGETRRANLDMLTEKAAAYEKTSYKGLFHFIRYIEKLKKFNTDFGEAAVVGEHEDTVRIMSIHKSKGLEFPVVFLAGMGKNFNKQDASRKILIDPELGIGTDYLDLEHRLKTPTLKKQAMKRKLELENLGEELRILYVAMTRAKEQLVMTAADRYLDKKQERYAMVPAAAGQIPFTLLSGAGCYLDWLLMSLGVQDCGRIRIETEEIPVAALVGEETARQLGRQVSKAQLLELDLQREYAPQYGRELEAALSYEYPFERDISLHTKISVSELKQLGQTIDEEETAWLPTIPEFLKEEQEKKGGATAGTAYHRALELLDFTAAMETKAQVDLALDELVETGRLAEESRKLVSGGRIWRFFNSALGVRMRRAAADGHLHKEQQFVFGVPACDIRPGDSGELVLIQGIIDAYLEEADGLVLVDYKTDRIAPGQEEKLIAHYGVQLEYYQKALEQMTGKRVKEKLIFSLTLGEEVRV